ncbi:COMM domain-containing protein 10-like [Oppia nitens]|uniref:COMM domain-containing protein 10-like n=1 Tax=Oppia nitens TaxID=1686743 RepID=UPI0023DB0909|nr:COMM domain-containing protein 10-like [Oppia nitens]
MFFKTPEISEAIDLMNGIDLSKFSKFVIRIADKLDENFDQIFSDEEEAKLIPILVVSDIRHVKLIVKTVHYLLRQIVYHLMKPRVIAKELTELGLDTEKVVAFAEICSTHLPAIVDRFKDKSFDISNSRLTDVNWSVKLLTNQSCRQYKDVVPLAQLDLTLKTNGQTDNHLSLDLDRKELWNLYENLEAIQTQLDSLYK